MSKKRLRSTGLYCSTFVALNAMRQLCLFIKLTHCVKCTKVEQYTAPGGHRFCSQLLMVLFGEYSIITICLISRLEQLKLRFFYSDYSIFEHQQTADYFYLHLYVPSFGEYLFIILPSFGEYLIITIICYLHLNITFMEYYLHLGNI